MGLQGIWIKHWWLSMPSLGWTAIAGGVLMVIMHVLITKNFYWNSSASAEKILLIFFTITKLMSLHNQTIKRY